MGPARARTCQHSKHSRRFLLRSHENTQNTALFRTAFVWPLLDVMTQDDAQPAASLRLLDLGRDSLIKVLELLDVPSIARAAQVRRLRLGSYFNWVLWECLGGGIQSCRMPGFSKRPLHDAIAGLQGAESNRQATLPHQHRRSMPLGGALQ